jgi:two-component system CheB/CheR fusion protein
MKMARKNVAFLVGLALVISVMVLVSLWAYSKIKEEADGRKHAAGVLDSANKLMSSLIDAETGERGYLLTGDESFLEPFLVVRDGISAHLEELHKPPLTAAAYAHLDALAPMIQAKLVELSLNVQLRRNNNMSAALANMRGSQGKPLMDSIRDEMDGFIQIERGVSAQHDEKFQSNMGYLFIIIVALNLFSLLCALLFVRFIYQETQNKLKNLVQIETQHLLEIQEGLNNQLQQVNVTLQASEGKLTATLNSIGDAVLATDSGGFVTLLNPLAEKLTGWSQAEANGRPMAEVFDIINEETRQPFKMPITETLAHGTMQGLANHTILISRAGQEYSIADSCAPIRNHDGEVIGAVMVFRNVTEHRETEIGLSKANRELEFVKKTADVAREYSESIINTVREPLISLDQNLRVVSASRSFYEVFKVKPEETVGQLIYDLGNKQWDIPKLRELLETILPQKATFDNYEVEHDFADIGRRIMLLNARQIQRVSGKERIILLAIEDITERRNIEVGLEKTRKELEIIQKAADEASELAESIINTVREPLISLDQDLRVVSVSRSFYEVFKVKPEETVGQLIYDLGNKQWDIPKLRELLETILPQKATFGNYEVEHDFADIGRRVMLLNARQIQRMSGKEKIILLAIEDITERRKVEKGLEKAHEELEELTTELKRTARAKSEFLANMSHELRTPLNSINGFSEVLYDEIFGTLNEKQKKYVNNVLVSGKHLLLLINQILDMAKVEAGKMKLALSILPTKSLLNEISLLVADMVRKKNLQMVLEIPEDLPDIEADELKVKEIIYNLLSNAVKFTPEGGVIGMRAKKAGPDIVIDVWDTGIGIAPENMGKIFEGFFRVDTPYSRVTEGTGLGLPLSKKMVELHGGELSATSEGLDKGTLIHFSLPIISAKAA